MLRPLRLGTVLATVVDSERPVVLVFGMTAGRPTGCICHWRSTHTIRGMSDPRRARSSVYIFRAVVDTIKSRRQVGPCRKRMQQYPQLEAPIAPPRRCIHGPSGSRIVFLSNPDSRGKDEWVRTGCIQVQLPMASRRGSSAACVVKSGGPPATGYFDIGLDGTESRS